MGQLTTLHLVENDPVESRIVTLAEELLDIYRQATQAHFERSGVTFEEHVNVVATAVLHMAGNLSLRLYGPTPDAMRMAAELGSNLEAMVSFAVKQAAGSNG